MTKKLRPTGYIEIDGKRYSARSEQASEQIDEGREVVVVDVDSTYLVVRPGESGGAPSR